MIYRFLPIFKSTIWGGDRMASFKGVETHQSQIGESWEISGVKGSESVVADGPEAGLTLSELIRAHGATLLGRKVVARYGADFPLLVKFIDARGDLSIQVHPDDATAAERHNGSRGKTEMWYVVDAAPEAKLLSGFNRKLAVDEYCRSVEDNTITDYLGRYDVKAGDVFYLPAGCVHAIGAGCFIAEIQETSDITYRIYDYNRRDSEGRLRELHTSLARDVINLEPYPETHVDYSCVANEPVTLVSCQHFITKLYDLTEEHSISLAGRDSFTIVMCVDGTCTLTDSEGNSIVLKRGMTVLVSASSTSLSVKPDGAVKLLTSNL